MIRRGQTATEYLIILAVVIVIALIVVGVIGGIPGIGQSGQSKASTAYWSTLDPIAIRSFSNSASGQGTMTIVFRNNGKNSYVVNTFIVDNMNVYTAGAGAGITLPIGSEQSYSNLSLGASTLHCTAGNKYAYEIQINYTDQSTNAIYTFKGTQKLEGQCAT